MKKLLCSIVKTPTTWAQVNMTAIAIYTSHPCSFTTHLAHVLVRHLLAYMNPKLSWDMDGVHELPSWPTSGEGLNKLKYKSKMQDRIFFQAE